MDFLKGIEEEREEKYITAKNAYLKNKKEKTKIEKRLKKLEKENETFVKEMHKYCEHKNIKGKVNRWASSGSWSIFDDYVYTCEECGYSKSSRFEIFDTHYGEMREKKW